MAATTTTRNRLSAALSADPLNADLRRVYADCLEEQGEEDEAKRQQTLAEMVPALRAMAGAGATMAQAMISFAAAVRPTMETVAAAFGRTMEAVANALAALDLADVTQEERSKRAC